MDKLRAVYADKRVGERFEFGRYPQGENGEIQPIVWRVLRRDPRSLLVISELSLDGKTYNDEFCEITWAECSLRRWLNGEFYNTAFNREERGAVVPGSVSNNAGPETEDRVFLLSTAEAESLFVGDDDRRSEPSFFAAANAIHADASGCCWWWLRSRGGPANLAAVVNAGGCVDSGGLLVCSVVCAVRPAVNLAF